MTDVTKDRHLPTIPRICRLDKAEIMGYDQQTREMYGDVKYRAPEVIKGQPYGFTADSWSFGVVLFYILTSQLPFDGVEKRKTSFDNTPVTNSRSNKELLLVDSACRKGEMSKKSYRE